MFLMLENLQKLHSEKIEHLKLFLMIKIFRYVIPPASPQDNGEHLSEFPYKWAAIHAGPGFIGKK